MHSKNGISHIETHLKKSRLAIVLFQFRRYECLLSEFSLGNVKGVLKKQIENHLKPAQISVPPWVVLKIDGAPPRE